MAEMAASGEFDGVIDEAGDDVNGPISHRLPREIKRSHVTKTHAIGKGAFGDVVQLPVYCTRT